MSHIPGVELPHVVEEILAGGFQVAIRRKEGVRQLLVRFGRRALAAPEPELDLPALMPKIDSTQVHLPLAQHALEGPSLPRVYSSPYAKEIRQRRVWRPDEERKGGEAYAKGEASPQEPRPSEPSGRDGSADAPCARSFPQRARW